MSEMSRTRYEWDFWVFAHSVKANANNLVLSLEIKVRLRNGEKEVIIQSIKKRRGRKKTSHV